MAIQKPKIDTTAIIIQEGVHYNRSWDSTSRNADWGITGWYNFVGLTGVRFKVHGYVGNDTPSITFWYENTAATYHDYWYIYNNDTEGDRECGFAPSAADIARIRFSIQLSKIGDTFMYVYQTGQIFFAGKNTPYYGHGNISELN